MNMKNNNAKKYPLISMIILNWNGKEDTKECMNSLVNLRYPKEKIEIIVSDNGSEDGSQESIKNHFRKLQKNNWNNLCLIENKKNLGAPMAYNIALKRVNPGCEYILKLDNDVVLSKGSLSEMLKIFNEEENIGIVGPKIMHYDNPKKISHGAGFLNTTTGQISNVDSPKKIECDFVTGCTMLIKKNILKELESFLDEKFFIYWDDTDFCFRVKKMGYKILYTPITKVLHKVSSSTKAKEKSIFSIYYYIRNKLLFIHKHSNIFQKIPLFTAYILIGVPKFILTSIFVWDKNINTKKIKYYLKAVISGILNRGGKIDIK